MVPLPVLGVTDWYGSLERQFHDQLGSRKDRISDLPDDVLSEILSRIPLLDAIKLSTLSRRWRNQWLNLPYLHLDWCEIFMSNFSNLPDSNNYKLYKTAFVRKVNHILHLFKDRSVFCFRLVFFFERIYASNVDKWINFAAEKKLESLNLMLDNPFSRLNPKFNEFYVISSSFLSRFPYLKNLHLDSCRLKLQSNFSLNMLKNLDLTYVHFEETGLLQCILSRLSTIEWLQLRHCNNLPELLCIGQNLNSLRFIMISNCPSLQEIELNAKNLKTFEFVGKVAVKCSLLGTSDLENVYICLTERVNNGAETVFKNLAIHTSSSLRTLVIRGEYPLIHKLTNQQPLFFGSVLKLDLYMRFDDMQVKNTLLVLRCLLKSFPSLQKLYIRMPHTNHPETRRRDQPPPIQFHTKLKKVEFGYFQSCWIEFASYILRSAAVLESMVISQQDKYYAGCGIWHTLEVDQMPLGKKERSRIYSALRGKAISPCVDVIIL